MDGECSVDDCHVAHLFSLSDDIAAKVPDTCYGFKFNELRYLEGVQEGFGGKAANLFGKGIAAFWLLLNGSLSVDGINGVQNRCCQYVGFELCNEFIRSHPVHHGLVEDA